MGMEVSFSGFWLLDAQNWPFCGFKSEKPIHWTDGFFFLDSVYGHVDIFGLSYEMHQAGRSLTELKQAEICTYNFQ